jgi:hypothetical protein
MGDSAASGGSFAGEVGVEKGLSEADGGGVDIGLEECFLLSAYRHCGNRWSWRLTEESD